MTVAAPIRVVLIDESPAQRARLRTSLQADGDIVVVAEASTYAGAAGAVARGEPDVVALGRSPAGGEEAAIARIMGRTPRPILVVDGAAGGAVSPASRRALVAGAAAVIGIGDRDDEGAALRRRVRALCVGAGLLATTAAGVVARPPATTAATGPAAPGGLPAIVAIASSTGGPSALEAVLRSLLGHPVAVVLVQHIDQRLLGGFADWLAKATGWAVQVAVEGTPPVAGVVHLGTGGRHLEVDARGLFAYRDEPRTIHMPSADQLFTSLAANAADRVVAAVLTGMGADGAAGLLALRDAGAPTVAQDEATCAVFGMARAAAELGAVGHLTPLEAIGPTILRNLRRTAGAVR